MRHMVALLCSAHARGLAIGVVLALRGRAGQYAFGGRSD